MASATVLIVDHEHIVQNVKSVLSPNGYRVLTAARSAEALRILRDEGTIELVASELSLPDGDGAALLRTVLVSNPAMAVMLMTEAREQGCDARFDILRKPFLPSDLLAHVARLIDEAKQLSRSLLTTQELHRASLGDVRNAQQDLSQAVKNSRWQRASRFCSDLRCSTLRAPAVLVADDDLILRYAIRRFLTRVGISVFAASNGDEALRISRNGQQPIDLLLTDFRMPDMNGLDLIQYLATERPQIKALLMTGDDLEVAGSFLRKPFELDDLLVEIATLLGPWNRV